MAKCIYWRVGQHYFFNLWYKMSLTPQTCIKFYLGNLSCYLALLFIFQSHFNFQIFQRICPYLFCLFQHACPCPCPIYEYRDTINVIQKFYSSLGPTHFKPSGYLIFHQQIYTKEDSCLSLSLFDFLSIS